LRRSASDGIHDPRRRTIRILIPIEANKTIILRRTHFAEVRPDTQSVGDLQASRDAEDLAKPSS
jgi:hypothetical protein